MGKEEDSRATGSRIGRDLKRLKSDGGATVTELREFLGQMQGRNPQEMIGMVANSGLTRSMLLATFLFVLVLGVLTVIPYFLAGDGADGATPVATQAAVEAEAIAEPVPLEGSEAEPGTDAEPEAAASQPGQDPDRAIDVMGIGEARIADPDENPLENKLDKLLDGID